MTSQIPHRRRASGDAQARLARILKRRKCRHWRRPAMLRGWADLPLFAHADALARRQRASQPAARHVQRLGVAHPAAARLIAELAGFRLEDDA